MHTMVIRVGEQTQENRYPLSLHIDDGQNPDWAEQPAAADWIPASLPAPAGGLDIAAVQRALLTETADTARLIAVGDYLYRVLADTQVGRAWADAVADFTSKPKGSGLLRTFFDVRPPGLSALPWELMVRDGLSHLFLDERHVCVRGSYQRAAETPVPVPIRLLVAVGDPHDSALRAEDEVDAIWSGLRDHPGEWHVEVMWGPTSPEFSACFKEVRPHIFHFIGHSVLSPYGNSPSLAFRPVPGGPGWELDSHKIANMLGAVAPRLVFLNSCRSSDHAYRDDEREGARTAAIGVAQEFRLLGSQATLGMQADIPSGPAVCFTGELYRLLAGGAPVDAAVRGARELLFQSEPAAPRVWALPALTVRGDPDGVLAMRMALARDAAQLIAERYGEIGSLVDRTAEHRKLWGGIDCGRLPAPAVLVTGMEKVGKSALVRSCLFTWSLRGAQVVYVDLRQPRKELDWLDPLRQVRAGLALYLPERAAEPVRRFNHELACLKAGLDPEPLPPAGGRTDDGAKWMPATEREPELRETLFASARRMLEEVAGGQPMLLAVDHLAAGMPNDVRANFVPLFLLPIAKGSVAQVSVVVAETTDKANQLLSSQFRVRAAPVTVTPFPRTIRLFRQFGALTGRPFHGRMQEISDAMAKEEQDPEVMPEEFRGIALLVKPAKVVR